MSIKVLEAWSGPNVLGQASRYAEVGIDAGLVWLALVTSHIDSCQGVAFSFHWGVSGRPLRSVNLRV